MGNYAYRFFDAVTLNLIGELELSNVAFNDPVKNIGSLTGKCVISPINVERARACFDFDKAIIGVFNDEVPMWAGFLLSRRWDAQSTTLEVTYKHVKSYLYSLFFRPSGADTGVIGETLYGASGIEQTVIAQDLIVAGMGGSGSELNFQIPSTLSTGVVRDLTVKGLDFKYIGDLIDTMAKRRNGFEWTIQPEIVEGLPFYLFGRFFFPERRTGATGLFFEYDPNGNGNILDFGTPEESVANRATRVWASGAGTPPDQSVAVDTDPLVSFGQRLVWEKVSNYPDVPSPITLQDHAQQERLVLAQTFDQITIAVKPDNPDVLAYGPGDRCRIVINDLWTNIDVDNARIVDRSISPWYRGAGEAVSITVDLSDNELPEIEGG